MLFFFNFIVVVGTTKLMNIKREFFLTKYIINLKPLIMKKIILGAVALIIGAIGFAQNASVVLQSGPSQYANVDQIGANTSLVIQSNYNNDAFATQNGTSSGLQIQEGTNGLARLTQTGNTNVSAQYQTGEGNIVRASMIGDDNATAQFQSGDYNVANINIGTFGSDGNTAWQVQEGMNNLLNSRLLGNDNTSGQVQSGENNIANVYARGWRNEGYQLQGGQDNRAHIRIGYPAGGVSDNFAFQQQFGGTGAMSVNNIARIDQLGDRNTAGQIQGGDNIDDLRNNLATIIQTGNDNTAYQMQGGNDVPGATASNNTVFSGQNGNDNLSVQVQDGINNIARIVQDGNFGEGAQVQDGGWNEMYLHQVEGDLNTSLQVQLVGTQFSLSRVRQGGPGGNSAFTYQAGSSDTAIVNQF